MANENSTAIEPGTAYLIARSKSFKQVFTVTKEFTSIGRTGRNDVKLPFGSVSRTHATLVRTSMGYKITDASSKHGVVVNSMRVIEKYLQEGDKIEVGDVALKFTFKKPEESAADPQPQSTSAPAAQDPEPEIEEIANLVDDLIQKVRRLEERVGRLESK